MRKHYQKIFAFFFAISSLVLILTGCSKKENSSNKNSIVTSTNVYADIAQNVLGKYGKATAIITTVLLIHMTLNQQLQTQKKFKMQKLLLLTV